MTARERADAIVLSRDIPWQSLRDLIQRHIEEAEREVCPRCDSRPGGTTREMEAEPLVLDEARCP